MLPEPVKYLLYGGSVIFFIYAVWLKTFPYLIRKSGLLMEAINNAQRLPEQHLTIVSGTTLNKKDLASIVKQSIAEEITRSKIEDVQKTVEELKKQTQEVGDSYNFAISQLAASLYVLERSLQEDREMFDTLNSSMDNK